jgi:hypothetical protein
LAASFARARPSLVSRRSHEPFGRPASNAFEIQPPAIATADLVAVTSAIATTLVTVTAASSQRPEHCARVARQQRVRSVGQRGGPSSCGVFSATFTAAILADTAAASAATAYRFSRVSRLLETREVLVHGLRAKWVEWSAFRVSGRSHKLQAAATSQTALRETAAATTMVKLAETEDPDAQSSVRIRARRLAAH